MVSRSGLYPIWKKSPGAIGTGILLLGGQVLVRGGLGGGGAGRCGLPGDGGVGVEVVVTVTVLVGRAAHVATLALLLVPSGQVVSDQTTLERKASVRSARARLASER